jgi:hypothetical protein
MWGKLNIAILSSYDEVSIIDYRFLEVSCCSQALIPTIGGRQLGCDFSHVTIWRKQKKPLSPENNRCELRKRETRSTTSINLLHVVPSGPFVPHSQKGDQCRTAASVSRDVEPLQRDARAH